MPSITHGVIVGRPGEAVFHKALTDWPSFSAWIKTHVAKGPVWLTTDMRAHRNPTRQQMIANAGLQLSAQLASRCPACNAQGFSLYRREAGARCGECGSITAVACAEILRCPCCQHESRRALADITDPSYCDVCNP